MTAITETDIDLSDSLELIIEREVTTPTIQIQWCVEPELVEFLSENEIEDPQLLIVKNPYNSRKEDRVLVPLDKMMDYIQLNTAGEVEIFATVVWPTGDNDFEGLKEEFF
ncbi:MAG: hypothetical protein BRC25_01175, partial [Parcubacteria group bacterium SW_6_46_9]